MSGVPVAAAVAGFYVISTPAAAVVAEVSKKSPLQLLRDRFLIIPLGQEVQVALRLLVQLATLHHSQEMDMLFQRQVVPVEV